jgi:hypothetical protein
MYGTTREFLERFGLNDVADLPKVEDMSELLGFDLPAGVGEPEPQNALPFEMSEMSEMSEVAEVKNEDAADVADIADIADTAKDDPIH